MNFIEIYLLIGLLFAVGGCISSDKIIFIDYTLFSFFLSMAFIIFLWPFALLLFIISELNK